MNPNNPFNTLQSFGSGKKFYSLPALEKAEFKNISRLPVSIRLVLESMLRDCDGKRVSEQAVKDLAAWKPTEPPHSGIMSYVLGLIVANNDELAIL